MNMRILKDKMLDIRYHLFLYKVCAQCIYSGGFNLQITRVHAKYCDVTSHTAKPRFLRLPVSTEKINPVWI